MATTVVGLEITEESVRAVELTTGAKPALISSGEVALPPGAARDSEVLDAEAVSVALRQLWAQAGIKAKDVVLAVGSRRVLVREFSTAAMRLDLIKASLPYQVQDLLPVPANQAVLDFYPISESDGQVHGLLVAAVSETIEELINAVARAKLRVTRVDLTPFGLARAAKLVAAPGQTVATIYIGGHTTYVVVATDGVPTFVRVIPLDVTTADASAPVSEEARELELAVGAPVRMRTELRAVPSAAPTSVVGDVVTRVRSTLSFYSGRPGAAPVTSVFITGAGASVPGLQSSLVSALDAPVRTIEASDVVLVKSRGVATIGDAQRLVSTLGVLLGEEK